MKALIYCKNSEVSNALTKYIEGCQELEVECVRDYKMLIDKIEEERIYMAVLSMNDSRYAEITDKIKSNKTGTVIYLLGQRVEQSAEVYKCKCDGFINIQNLEDDVKDCLDNFSLLSKRIHRLRAVTFGRFDLFVDGERMEISNKKSKELLALCIDKCGGRVSMEEATDKLWYGRPYDERVKGLYRKAVMSLNAYFRSKEIKDVFINGRGYCYIKKSAFDCDYYKFLEDPQKRKMLYTGEYMFEYSWAEETLARLEMLYFNF